MAAQLNDSEKTMKKGNMVFRPGAYKSSIFSKAYDYF